MITPPTAGSCATVDRNTPEMDGFEVVENIRRNPQFAGATIMMLSSAGKLEDVKRCKELGVAAYLTKPVQQSARLNAIVTALDGPGGGKIGRSYGPRCNAWSRKLTRF